MLTDPGHHDIDSDMSFCHRSSFKHSRTFGSMLSFIEASKSSEKVIALGVELAMIMLIKNSVSTLFSLAIYNWPIQSIGCLDSISAGFSNPNVFNSELILLEVQCSLQNPSRWFPLRTVKYQTWFMVS